MATFKCKMCGGNIIPETDGTGICDSCGTRQTLPKQNSTVITNLFNRANNLRLKNEFDKALAVYEKILDEDDTESEAHWGTVLCKYGIEYVDDPKTGKRIPTCHRMQYESVLTDTEYLAALKNADIDRRKIYEQQANDIAELQKDILDIVNNEPPFDVFICYKETDEKGKRTQDSVLANEIYHQLTQEGLRVFYAAITLEDKIGREYEPYIFAALNSAKVMLVIGTKPENFEAVWVKNEWSRFLKLAKKDHTKLLIPCYKDMDAYELPDEFSHLQAQDMSKIGFINDIVRGIRKVTVKQEPKPTVKEIVKETVTTTQNENGNLQAILERGYMAIEDEEWAKADGFFEQALNFDAKLVQAYIGKLMIEFRIKDIDELVECENFTDKNNTYKKIIKFGDAHTQERFNSIFTRINEKKDAERRKAEREAEEKRIAKEKRKQKRIKITKIVSSSIVGCLALVFLFNYLIIPAAQYSKANRLSKEGNVEDAYEIYTKLNGFKDSEEKAEKLFTENFATLKCYGSVFAADFYCIGIKEDNKLVSTGENKYKQGNVNDWKDILTVAVGPYHSVGLKKDCTVITSGDEGLGKCDVSDWKHIVDVAAGSTFTAGLKSDGTVVTTKFTLPQRYDIDTSNWKDIVSISANTNYLLGLKSNGTVVSTGDNASGKCDVSKFTNIIQVAAGCSHSVGLKNDGTVVATGANSFGQCDVNDWKEIVSVAAGYWHTVGIKRDGTVVATGYNVSGQCEVDDWRDIVQVACGVGYTIGIKSDGSVVTAGNNVHGECNFKGLKLKVEK